MRSACGTLQSETPAVVPICGHLDSIRRLMLGDIYIGRGARERDLPKSIWGNPFKVAKYGRRMAIDEYGKTLVADGGLHARIWSLSGCRLVCHCTPNQACHADSLIELYRAMFSSAFDRDNPATGPPSSDVLRVLAKLREEPPEDEGSSADEGAPPKESGWKGRGLPMLVGTGKTSRELCDTCFTRPLARRVSKVSTEPCLVTCR